MEKSMKNRPKTFSSMDSLWYEEERLATFIDWPVPYISANDLAKDGFYYLRTKDHCACAFCRGVIGKWEEGDVPRNEHKKHFPDCAFVLGNVTPNIPLQQGYVLSRVVATDAKDNLGQDVCGFGGTDNVDPCLQKSLITNSLHPDKIISNLGLRQYCGPKRKEYLTTEVRLRTFRNWPERVRQKPAELAEAGFYYCGLSDHVRCFHCGNGLRNWESDDKPWEEHARWFPDCHFVFLKKGIDFINKVKHENPYYKKPSNLHGVNETAVTSYKKTLILTDDDMDKLMELHIMKQALEMGFNEQVVKTALKNRLQETGQPFFSLRTCIDTIIIIMEKERKNVSNSPRGKKEDEPSQQNEKLSKFNASMFVHETAGSCGRRYFSNRVNRDISQSLLPVVKTSVNSTIQLHKTGTEVATFSRSPSIDTFNEFPNTSAILSSEPNLPIFTAFSRPPLSSFTLTDTNSPSENPNATSIFADQYTLNSNGETLVDEDVHSVSSVKSSCSGDQRAEFSQTERPSNVIELESSLSSEVVLLISEADDIMEKTANLLSTPSTMLETSKDITCRNERERKNECAEIASTTQVKHEERGILEQELERIREKRICRVCMDKEMDVVFLPCTHMVTCSSCAVALTACPICRRVISYAFKPIIS